MDGIKITKKGLQGFIKHKISTSEVWAMRALIVIYNAQEDDEKRCGTARVQNGVGFNKVDAQYLSVVAERYKRKLTLKVSEVDTIQHKMQKYWKQIYDLSDMPKLESQYRKYIIEQERIIEGVDFIY